MKVPSDVVHNRPTPFPAGSYFGTLKEVSERSNEEQTWMSLNLLFRDISPLDDDSADVGNRPYRARVTVINDGQGVWDIEVFNDDTDFRLRQAAGILSQLAFALGAGKETEDKGIEVEMESFCDDLLNGVYNDSELIFEVGNRTFKRRDGSSGTSDDPLGFSPPYPDNGDEEAEVAEETEKPAVRRIGKRQ